MKEKLIIVLAIIIVLGGIFFYANKKPAQTVKSPTPVATPTPNPANPTVKPTVTVSAGSVVGSVKSAKLGEYLTDTKGMTLYVFGDDKKLTSSCTGECLKMWPAFVYDQKNIASSTDLLSKRMNVIKRADGTYQYAYGEKPVYYYVGDTVSGDTKGNGLSNGKWSVVIIK